MIKSNRMSENHLKIPDDVPSHVLVAGIDGSGKSTLLSGISEQMNFVILEPTSSESARNFRQKIGGIAITSTIVAEREQIFVKINLEHNRIIRSRILSDTKIATSGDLLVTRLSHAVMRRIITGNDNEQEVVKNWANSNHQRPEAIFLTHAPFGVIRERIEDRQQKGDSLEQFWGFNSLYFLAHYQDAWLRAIYTIKNTTDIVCLDLDTSIVPIDHTVNYLLERL